MMKQRYDIVTIHRSFHTSEKDKTEQNVPWCSVLQLVTYKARGEKKKRKRNHYGHKILHKEESTREVCMNTMV